MLVAISAGSTSRPGISWSSAPNSRARRWSSARRSTSVERDERRGGGDTRLVDARPAEPTQRPMRQLDHLRAAREDRPHRRAQPLFRLTATVFAGAASFDTGIPSATAALKSRASSRCT